MNLPKSTGTSFVGSDSSNYLELVKGFLKTDAEGCHKRLRFKPPAIEKGVESEKKTKMTYVPAILQNAPSVQSRLDFNVEAEISYISN